MSTENEAYWPGHIKLDTGTSERHSPGNKAVTLNADAENPDVAYVLNNFSATNPNALITSIIPLSPTSLLVLYTAVMSSERIKEMTEIHKIAEEIYKKRQEVAREAENKALETQKMLDDNMVKLAEASTKETERLAELGRKHEKNCGKKGAKS